MVILLWCVMTEARRCIEERRKGEAAWIKVETKAILTIYHHIITRNYRISLSHSDNRNFILQIRNVQESDKGGFDSFPIVYMITRKKRYLLKCLYHHWTVLIYGFCNLQRPRYPYDPDQTRSRHVMNSNLVLLKTHRVQVLMHVKSVQSQRYSFSVEARRGGSSSGVVLVTGPRFKIT
ncbi:UNVERIFIED_CONTAM: hypothetical protein NCL1_11692 [Trichonephila clavipes]